MGTRAAEAEAEPMSSPPLPSQVILANAFTVSVEMREKTNKLLHLNLALHPVRVLGVSAVKS